MRCSSYCTAEYYNIDNLSKYLRNEGLDPKFYDDVIHIHKYRPDEEGLSAIGDIFYFPYGCVVFWNFSEEEELQYLEDLKPYEQKSVEDFIYEASNFVYGSETTIHEEEDEIVLENDDVLLKLSMAHGLSQSVKLDVFENSIATTIESTRYLPAELAEKGKISLSQKKISQKIGALFAERNSVNLHSDILDTPEFFWRRPRYEPYYHMASQYMDIITRLDILNRRLDVIHELYDILSNELKHSHSSRLEWVIILLIVTEVIMHIIKDFLKWI
jgi:uncharacterized Rmd1/YagE family protein